MITLQSRARRLQVIVCNLTFPILSDEDIIRPVQACFEQHPGIKVASFESACIFTHVLNDTFGVNSHINSYPAVVLPIKRLVAMGKQRGAIVMVDGAHALG